MNREVDQTRAADVSAPEVATAAPSEPSGQAQVKFTSHGAIPPVHAGADAGRAPTASERAFGGVDEHASASHTFTGPTHLRVTASGLNVRSSPDAGSHDNIVGGLHRHAEIDAIERDGAWVRISYKGSVAFVHGAYVEEIKPAEAAPVAPPVAAPAPAPAAEAAPAPDKKAVEAAKPHIDAAPEVAAAPHVEHVAKAPEQPHEHHAAPAPVAPAPVAPAHDTSREVHAEYEAILKEVEAGHLDQGAAVTRFVSFVKSHNGGEMTPTGLELMAFLVTGVGLAQKQHVAKKLEAAPAAAHVDAPPKAAAHITTPTPAAAPAHAAAPAAPVVLADGESISSLAAGLDNPKVLEVVAEFSVVTTQAAGMRVDKDDSEYRDGKARQGLVKQIGELRKNMAALDGLGLDEHRLAKFRAAIYRKLEAVAPYYYQGNNILTIESKQGLAKYYSTCNMTSLGMSLEQLGKTPGDYGGSTACLLTAASENKDDLVHGDDVHHERKAEHTAAGATADLASLQGLRMPDFLELAAVAEEMNGVNTPEAAAAAKAKARDHTKISTELLVKLAKRFGVSCTNADINWNLGDKMPAAKKTKHGTISPQEQVSDTLEDYGKGHRGNRIVGGDEVLIDKHNKAERSGKEKDQKGYEDYYAGHSQGLHADNIDEKLPLDKYRDSVIATLQPMIDSGAAVMVGFWMHWTRLYKLDEAGVIVQDPSSPDRATRHITWEEARALGCFWHNLRFQ